MSIDDLPRTANRERGTIDVRTFAFDEGGPKIDEAPLRSDYVKLNIDHAPQRINAKR